MRSAASEGPFVIEFIERHCRITKGEAAGRLVKLVSWQRDLITDLFALSDGSRRYRRGYVQMPRKNGKTFLLACVALYEAVFGELGGEIYFVAGDRMQASRAFGEIRKIVEADRELRGMFTFYKHSAEIASTGTVLRVLSADAGLQLGLEPSLTVFDEVAVQANDRLWNAMSLGSGTRAHPMIVGISTPGWEMDSLAYRLYAHGRKVLAGEIDDPTFFFHAFEPSDWEADHTDPKVWAEANPSLGAFLHAEDFAAALASTEENEFRRFRLGQWTSTHSVAFASGVWEAAGSEREVLDGTECVVSFVAARQRDTVAIVACTLSDPHAFPIRIWEETERVDPLDVAEELRAIWGRYSVHEFLQRARLVLGAARALGGGSAGHQGPEICPAAGGAVAAVLRRDRRAAPDALAGPGARAPCQQPRPHLRAVGASPGPGCYRGPTGRRGAGLHGRLRRRDTPRACRRADHPASDSGGVMARP